MCTNLSAFLKSTFPDLNGLPIVSECWVFKAIHSEHPGVNVLSEAVQVVSNYHQLDLLRSKLRKEHPLDRPHNPQYDARVTDCLTEACAFAWANMRGLGAPTFSNAEGTPDISVETGYWVEAKAIHGSEANAALMKHMVQGTMVSGQATEAGPGLYGKFKSAFEDAKKKFERVRSRCNIVFFNLTSVDIPQMAIKDQVIEGLARWAESEEKLAVDTKIVVCYSYDWKNPCLDPFGV